MATPTTNSPLRPPTKTPPRSTSAGPPNGGNITSVPTDPEIPPEVAAVVLLYLQMLAFEAAFLTPWHQYSVPNPPGGRLRGPQKKKADADRRKVYRGLKARLLPDPAAAPAASAPSRHRPPRAAHARVFLAPCEPQGHQTGF